MSVQFRPYQIETIRKAVERDGRLLIANDVGTGKTLCAIATARVLRCHRVLVVTPLSVVSVWRRELERYWPEAQFLDATIGTIAERARFLRESGDGVAVVGYESYWREPLRARIREWRPDMAIMDEAHRIKTRTAKQSGFAHRLVEVAPRRLALTATPMTQGPEDLFSIFKFVEPSVFGTRYADFEWQYIIKGGYFGREIVGYRNRELLESKLHMWTTRVTKDEALDLPEEQPVEIAVKMSARAREQYKEMKREAIAEIESLKGERGVALSRIVLTNILRLKQITSGFVKVDDGRELDIDTSKLDALMDLMSDRRQRCVVFAHFTHDIANIRERIKDRPTWELSGGQTQAQRDQAKEEWEGSDDGVLVCQIAVSSLGIDLTAASIAYYYSVDYSLTNWIQCHGRLHRHGQINKVTNYYLITEHSVDEAVYNALSAKQDLTKSVLDESKAREIFA